MTPEQIGHIRNSWALMSSASDDVAMHFYNRLFELDPSTQKLFAGIDMSAQGEKLIYMLSTIVRGVEDMPRLLPAVETLGQRHRGYGVKDYHYATVGEALLSTFQKVLGPAFTPAARESWSSAFSTLAQVMISAGRKAA